MRILTLVQGLYGRRITETIRCAAIPGWTVTPWSLPTVLPPVIDYPEEYLPAALPAADLLISLGEHPGVAELLPDIVRLCGARAAIVPIDNQAWLPSGLARQLVGWLAPLGVDVVLPKPFCSLTESTYNAYRRQVTYQAPLISAFARHFGQPQLQVEFDTTGTTIHMAQVIRETPCGCASHVAAGLAGVTVEDAARAAGMLHHHYPCLAGMAIDPDYNDTLMHVAGHLLMDEIARGVRPHSQPPAYLRPPGRSE